MSINIESQTTVLEQVLINNMIYNFLTEYLSILIFLFIALFLSAGFILANFLASPSNPDPEKLSAYECGFEAFDDSRMEFC